MNAGTTTAYKPLIALSRRIPDASLAILRELGEVRMPAEHEEGGDLAPLFKHADGVLVIPGDCIDAKLLASCPRLRLVITIRAGFDHIDLQACTARGIRVAHTPGAVCAATADMAFGLLLAASRRIVEADAFVRAGRWVGQLSPLPGQDVHHTRMGIIGLGRIGALLARRARGFDMDVCYHSRRRISEQEEAALGVRWLPLDELLTQSDAVMVQVPYGPATHHLVGTRELSLMKKTAVLVNTARGGVVDDAALAAALRDGRIAAAGLDVTEGEPKVHPELLALPNVVLTPHLGAATHETHRQMAHEAFQNLVGALRGAPLANCLNPEAQAPAQS
ncbi:D-glycerate dehydrogenase [Cupriavidus necator]|uniref:D-glycerate dehydrogenase n=1 Tax=Cupriavidus necator TaxID=106590 RepID=A0A1U9UZ41_CUPNE|nr:D-glycerate dehydrogenase [Cupriavidus necator]AQV97829.1 D-glycerate dehydrogenase [Cupriavidus necator]